ncbi:MarR family transcriptional regulator [Amycolatopsis sp. FBCC-B4732]|uniref:MarR family winged helix-turn-helix transcriptional regulator n=1 Tax=Amycolatopsis sp. FBCC-B4732 TaxID=3079339 RepID=UPI001FF63C4F|nr:MarR family transcriptional regulator [Amycolatopsis sp. FBCC-B4732]UOX90597.1 MarR family transcriptional regulator [Amycolatopsis sp. FBCC-B4732]
MERLAEQLRAVIVATDEYRRAVASALGIGVHEAAVLGELLHEGQLPPSALVKRLGIASASVTALLDRLEAAGFTRRERHPTDRRSVLVVLTPVGRRAIEASFALFREDVYQSVARSEPAHIREFTVVLIKIAQALRERAAQPASIGEALTDRVRMAGEEEDRSAEPAG